MVLVMLKALHLVRSKKALRNATKRTWVRSVGIAKADKAMRQKPN